MHSSSEVNGRVSAASGSGKASVHVLSGERRGWELLRLDCTSQYDSI
jgi:hypothetical protein